MSNIISSWQRIEKWYCGNVSAEDFSLASGADASTITDAERRLGMQLPADVRESYCLHNGSNQVAVFEYGYHLLSLDEVVAQWTFKKRLFEEEGSEPLLRPDPIGRIKNMWWNPMWIPFTHNAGGDHQCIDMDPDLHGGRGQIIRFNHEVGPQYVLAGSLDQWLFEFAELLENGSYRFDANELCLIPINSED